MDDKQFEELNKKIDALDAKFTKAHNDKNEVIKKLRPLFYVDTILLIAAIVLLIVGLIQ